jgi:AbrB family looped-hinge helix DNA binding protein
MQTAKITSKGQVTLPKTIREHLKLNKGDRIEFLLDANGKVTLLPVTSDVKQLKGIVPKPKKAITINEMNRAILEEGGRL